MNFRSCLWRLLQSSKWLLENLDHAHIRQFQLGIQNDQLCWGSRTSFGVSNQMTVKIANSPCWDLWPLSWAKTFSGISASKSLEIQVYLTEWFVTLFPLCWRPAFFAAVDRNFPVSILPRSAFIYQPRHLSVDYTGRDYGVFISNGRWLRNFL